VVRPGLQLNRPVLALAPLAGWSDTVFRLLCKQMGAGLLFSEMASADAIVRNQDKTLELLKFSDAERPIGLQLFGAEPDTMAGAVERVACLKPDFIDLNFGCPARKVVKRGAGAALLRDLGAMRRIAAAACAATDLPVTAKIRSGWDRSVAPEAGRILQDCGIAMITLHPRTAVMGFSGRADWTQIAAIKRNLSIPVLGNGDVCNGNEALQMLRTTGCDGVMIGRAARGNPWIFRQVTHFLRSGSEPEAADVHTRLDYCLRHVRQAMQFYGAERGLRKMRKHMAVYVKGMPGTGRIKNRLFTTKSYAELHHILTLYKNSASTDRA